MILTDEQITKAVAWWADRVCAPRFSGLTPEERKDPSNGPYQMAETIAACLAKPIAEGTRRGFVDALTEILHRDNPRWLNVDYDPDRFLTEAAEKAGAPIGNFPWKTAVSFYEDGKAAASCGYCEPYVAL